MTGEEALHDLRLFVEDVTDAANVPAQAAGERVLTVEELSRLFKVSTKTISRWRQDGLVSRRFVFDGRKRVGFLQSSVDRFVAEHEDRVRRGTQFSQLNDTEKETIVARARRLAQAGGCPAEITKRLAKHLGRSIETIRYTLKQYDQDHPETAIFPDHTGVLSVDTKRQVYQQYRRGISVDALAKQYCRTKTSIYRIINEIRGGEIRELPLDLIPNPEFERPTAEKTILTPMPTTAPGAERVSRPDCLLIWLACTRSRC